MAEAAVRCSGAESSMRPESQADDRCDDAMGIQIVWTAENTYLVLDEQLDTLDGGGGGLGDGGRDTTHWR